MYKINKSIYLYKTNFDLLDYFENEISTTDRSSFTFSAANEKKNALTSEFASK